MVKEKTAEQAKLVLSDFDSSDSFFVEDGTVIKNLPQLAEFIRNCSEELYSKYGIEAGAWRAGALPIETGFINEKYAMIITGPWNIKTFKDVNFGIGLIPSGPTGRSATNVGGSNMVIMQDSKFKKESIDFLKYLLSDETQIEWGNKLGQISVNMEANKKIDTSQNPYLRIFMEQIKYASPPPQLPRNDLIYQVMNPEMEAALSGNKSVEDALKDATKRINKDIISVLNE